MNRKKETNSAHPKGQPTVFQKRAFSQSHARGPLMPSKCGQTRDATKNQPKRRPFQMRSISDHVRIRSARARVHLVSVMQVCMRANRKATRSKFSQRAKGARHFLRSFALPIISRWRIAGRVASFNVRIFVS